MSIVMYEGDVRPLPEGIYVMGGKIGTAVHTYLETEALKRPDLTPETKVTIGTIEGYGTIKGTSDLYIKKMKTVVDHKTSTKEKVAVYRALEAMDALNNIPEFEPETHTKGRKTVKRYKTQGDLYGLGVENRGDEVETIALNFVPRDAKTYDDIYVMEFDYDRANAERAMNRARLLWSALQQGRELDSIKSDAHCYTCNVLRTQH